MVSVDADEETAEFEVHPDDKAEENDCCDAENDKSDEKGVGSEGCHAGHYISDEEN